MSSFYLYSYFLIITCCITLHTATMNSEGSSQAASQYALLVKNAEKLNRERLLRSAADKNQINKVKFIIQEGIADINAQDKDGDTALYLATSKNNVEIAKILLAHDANPNIQNDHGNTPLHKVVFVAKSSKFLQLLVDHKADPLIKNRNGYRPDSFLAHTFQGATPLKGIDTTKNTFLLSSHRILLSKRLECLEKEINLLNKQLCETVRCNQIENLTSLLNKGAHIDYQNIYDKNTPLHDAAFYGHESIVELLLTRGASINILNRNGYTAFHVALHLHKYSIARMLLLYGADSTLENKNSYRTMDKNLFVERGKSPIEWVTVEYLKNFNVRHKILLMHNIMLCHRLEKMTEKDETITLKKYRIPSAHNS